MFEKGKSGNPNGRPRGSRSQALEAIFSIFNEDIDKFKDDLRAIKEEKGTVAFYDRFVAPLQPKNIELSGDSSLEVAVKTVAS